MSDELTPFQRKLAERRAREAAEKAAKTPSPAAASTTPEFDPDLIPDAPYDLTDSDHELDRVVNNIDILDAYARWCGKMTPKILRGQRENIMISCPMPGHPDKEASAWVNLDKQTWFCGGCQMGGDAHDIAAFHFGFSVPDYKNDDRFHKLRIKMAEDFGYHYEKFPGGISILVGPSDNDSEDEPAQESTATPVATVAAPEPAQEPSGDEPQIGDSIAPVVDLYDDADIIEYPKLDWRSIIPKNTFLDVYMKLTTVDDVVEEYHFWHALMALGFACGRQARLWDSIPVYGNLFVCTLGPTGSGKSKAKRHLDSLIEAAMPHDWSDPSSRGVRFVKQPGSAENLIHQFSKPVVDPTSPKVVQYYAPVVGLIDYNELSALIGRANRQGNVIKPTMMSFYDMERTVSTASMTSGEKRAEEPFACAITTTQPAALKTLLGRSDDDSGFLNRWVFATGPEKKRFAIGGVRVDMTEAVMPLQRILAWSASFGDNDFVNWSEDAAKSFTEFFHETIEVDKRHSSNALLTRIDLLMKKIILLFSANKMEKEVSATTVWEAIQCYSYIKDSYGIPAAQIGNTLQQEITEQVLYQVQRMDTAKKGVTLNQISKALKRRKYPNDLILKVIDSLTKLGELEALGSKPGQAGRPTVRYRYVG